MPLADACRQTVSGIVATRLTAGKGCMGSVDVPRCRRVGKCRNAGHVTCWLPVCYKRLPFTFQKVAF